MKASITRAAALAGGLVLVAGLLPGGTAAARQASLGAAAVQPTARTVPPGNTRANNNCPGETPVFYDPGQAQDIVLPTGYKASVFARDLNFPTAVAFVGDREHFKVVVLESGSGLPGRCNPSDGPGYGGRTSPTNPFTPDLLVFDNQGNLITGPLGKPSRGADSYQPDGPAIGLSFAHGLQGGKLFSSDSNQQTDGGAGPNHTSRLVMVDLATGAVTSFVSNLPTGDHPTEQVLVKDGFVYWSQGSATNTAVVGHDNGGGTHEHDIPCQNVTLSGNNFDSGDGHFTAGYSDHGVSHPAGFVVPAFTGAQNGMHVCTGAIMRTRIDDPIGSMQAFSWGYRNPYAIRFSPEDHVLKGNLFLGEDGEDERGARPTNGAPDRLQLAAINPDGTPDYHGWPDFFGFLPSTQRVFNPIGGPADDLCSPPAMPVFSAANCAAVVQAKDVPVKPVLQSLPQQQKGPVALEPADSSMTGIDFAPNSFVTGVVHRGAALVSREGDFGFSPGNGEPEEGHDVQLVNFSRPGEPLQVSLQRFAYNCKPADQTHPNGVAGCSNPADQAFTDILHAFNRPTFAMFGPDGALYVIDYGAVRDLGQSDPAAKFTDPRDGPLVQFPFTGTIWKITRA